MMSNSTSRNGGATLFLTTLTRVWLPTTSSRSLTGPMRRMSRRTRGVELERVAAGGGLRAAEHHADLHADLVDEDDQDALGAWMIEPVSLRSAWLISRACRPTWLSPISPSISASGTSAATESIDDDVDRARAHQRVGDLERLLAGVGLGDQQLVEVDAQLAGVGRVERVLGVDEGAGAAGLLGLGDGRAAPAWSCPSFRARRSRRSRPRGRPPTPSAMSRPSEPVETVSISTVPVAWPSFITEPLPKARSICAIAASRARCRSSPRRLTTGSAMSISLFCQDIGARRLSYIWGLARVPEGPMFPNRSRPAPPPDRP